METIIGLGHGGCAIAKSFQQYPQYDVYLIDTEEWECDNFFSMQVHSSHEEYEEKCPSFKKFFSKVDTPALLVIGGGGKISGSALRVLEALRHVKTSVLYVYSDESFMSELGLQQHKAVFNVLQQYARSAAVESMYIISNDAIADVVGDVSVKEYFVKINEMLVSTFHMINVFKHSNSEMDTFTAHDPTARIFTVGMLGVEDGEEKMFFNLTHPREKRYYYAINNSRLESDGTLFRNIQNLIKERIKENDKLKTSYGIYSTNYETDFAYCVSCSSVIQKGDIE